MTAGDRRQEDNGKTRRPRNAGRPTTITISRRHDAQERFRPFLHGRCRRLYVFAGATSPALAQDANTVKIGVLTDMSGPYSAMGGQGSVVAAKMAVEDCLKNECKGMKIEILSADNQNKPDVGVTRAREWLDRDKVEAIADLTNSSVALAVQKLIKDKGGIAMYSGPATGALTTAECAPTASTGCSTPIRRPPVRPRR
jgi:ABC-type branched-subunit amino acid transport system substrate-binding protein